MTNALIPHMPPRPARLTLDDDTWTQIADAYLAGATAPELAARYHVSRSSIHRHMKKRNASKRGVGASVFARAHAAATVAEEDARRRHRLSADDLHDLADQEPHDPAVLAQVALTASGNAMMTARFGEARALADLALLYGRAAAKRPESFRTMLLRALFDRRWADILFSHTHRDGEAHLKRAYWDERTRRDAAETARADEERRLRARVAELEALLRTLGQENPSPPRGGEGGSREARDG